VEAKRVYYFFYGDNLPGFLYNEYIHRENYFQDVQYDEDWMRDEENVREDRQRPEMSTIQIHLMKTRSEGEAEPVGSQQMEHDSAKISIPLGGGAFEDNDNADYYEEYGGEEGGYDDMDDEPPVTLQGWRRKAWGVLLELWRHPGA